jgi:hypothetical protein
MRYQSGLEGRTRLESDGKARNNEGRGGRANWAALLAGDQCMTMRCPRGHGLRVPATVSSGFDSYSCVWSEIGCPLCPVNQQLFPRASPEGVRYATGLRARLAASCEEEVARALGSYCGKCSGCRDVTDSGGRGRG